MRYTLGVILLLSWGLWIGATLATFVFGLHLFHTHADLAPVANSAMFDVFALYELPLAGIAILSTGLMLVTFRSKPAIAMVLVLVMAGGMGVIAGLGFTPAMEALRAQGKTHTPAFARLHGKTMITMTTEVVLLLGAGALLPMILVSPRARAA